MLGRNGNIAYVRYNSQGRIVPGGPIISPYRPKVGNWQPVSKAIGNTVTLSNSLRAFVRLDAYGRVVPSSLLLLSQAPSDADSGTYWLEINAMYRPYVAPTTTTTTSSTSSTTSTSTSTTSTTTTLGPSTTTTSTTNSNPVNFTVTEACQALNTVALFRNFSGGSGQYNGSSQLYSSESAALNGQFSSTVILIGESYSVGDYPANGTYWVAIRDVNNHNNKKAKSFYVSGTCWPATSTTTTTAPLGTLNFSINPPTCLGNSIEIIMNQFSISGKPLGIDSCYPGTAVYLTEAEALAGSFSSVGANYYTQFKFTTPSPLVTTTYWVAAKDMTNPNNKLAKSFTVTPCPQVPYNSLYVGFRPINTVWVTFN